jgi:hypothetical protein
MLRISHHGIVVESSISGLWILSANSLLRRELGVVRRIPPGFCFRSICAASLRIGPEGDKAGGHNTGEHSFRRERKELNLHREGFPRIGPLSGETVPRDKTPNLGTIAEILGRERRSYRTVWETDAELALMFTVPT